MGRERTELPRVEGSASGSGSGFGQLVRSRQLGWVESVLCGSGGGEGEGEGG